MNVLSKIVSFLAVFCVSQAADAALRAGGAATNSATSRVSIATPGAVTTSPRRMAVMTPTTTSTVTGAALLAQTECVDSYTSCIKESNACGENFEECTTNELFYAQMPKCNSVLMQCSSAGISTLFGTSNTAYLSAEYANSYPAPGSLIGQYISAGEILNRLDTGKCVQRYTQCLKGSSVCGSDFEYCTTYSEFRKQKIFCSSVLALCQEEGVVELFGTSDTTQDPFAGSRLSDMISEGLDYAAAHAVDTCYKKADKCFLDACQDNPLMCIADTNKYLAQLAGQIKGNTGADSSFASDTVQKRDILSRLTNLCKDEIGGRIECHMTANSSTARPSNRVLADEFERGAVFETIYGLREKSIFDSIAEMRGNFDEEAKNNCAQTIASCAAANCGDGLMSACYQTAFKTTTEPKSISNKTSRDAIKAGCEFVVNGDSNCQYVAAAAKNPANFKPEYTFEILFPEASANNISDPIGVITTLNVELQTKFSDAAIAELEKECKKTVESCIRSMCGADFVKCYRNRSDIMSDTYSVSTGLAGTGTQGTWNSSFAKSMNKVSGILDFTIIRGLCGSAVQDSAACEEHLKIQAVKGK